MKSQMFLLVDSHNGVYTPKCFKENYDSVIAGQMVGGEKQIELNVDAETWEDISDPNNEYYWESWELILNNTIIISGGERYYLNHEEDLWAIPEGLSFEDCIE